MSLPARQDSPAPAYRHQPLRVACVQYDVKLGRVEENARRVEEMTSGIQSGSIDLLVLPEMALSGYMFQTPASILPYLEPQRIGTTSLLARSLARRIGCHVVAGYPESLEVPTVTEGGKTAGEGGTDVEEEGEGVGWNSAVLIGPSGEVLGNYRKTFRFETDKNWAKEGDGFTHFDLPEPLGRVAIGICMDMNPKDFIAPWDAFELATYCKHNDVDILVVPMNWLDPPAEPPNIAPELDPESPSEHNLNYWAARLTPLHDPVPGYNTPTPSSETASGGREVVFVACNRIGTEEGSKFVGTSCVMTVSSKPSRIDLVEVCNMSEERVLIATVT
ncbi:carbon-nitrogen hydrolase [Naematelia encephala]|uniref:Carbon-nitrogen hydrolase n=1 Tax=Naematelia encephala TaxID=71784 RepID=A0A1Y2BBQ3_9TREE|nr:carbon-nitrogen hydrolase [Naematelia encephala]